MKNTRKNTLTKPFFCAIIEQKAEFCPIIKDNCCFLEYERMSGPCGIVKAFGSSFCVERIFYAFQTVYTGAFQKDRFNSV